MADRLSFADTVVINAAASLSLMVVHDADNQALALDVLAETVNAANWDHPYVSRLVVAVRQLLDAGPAPRKPLRGPFSSQMREIDQALAAVMKWRMGESLDQFRRQKAA